MVFIIFIFVVMLVYFAFKKQKLHPSTLNLIQSVESNNLFGVVTSIQNGADFRVKKYGDLEQDLIMSAIENNCDYKLILFLIDCGIELNYPDKAIQRSLAYALEYKRPDIAKLLIEKGADPNLAGRRSSLLAHYVTVKDMETVRFLVENGANINSPNNIGTPALSFAITNLDYQMIDFLLSRGANPYLKNQKGYSPVDTARYIKSRVQENYALTQNINNILDRIEQNN